MPKKKYYCEFCDRYFNDDRNTRVKHLNSAAHLRLKKQHYDLFRAPETILKEERQKKPCRRFSNEGFCPFGSNCTYSHYSKEDLNIIEQEVLTSKKFENKDIPTIESWLAKKSLNPPESMSKEHKSVWSFQLNANPMAAYTDLPPSLLPFNIKDYIDADILQWG